MESPLRDVEWFRREVLGGRVTRARVYQLVRAGAVPHVRIGARVLFDEETVARWRRGELAPNGSPAREASP